MKIHSLRHAFPSQVIRNGETLAYAWEQIGPSSVQVTVDIYGHLVPAGNRAALNGLGRLSSATKRNLLRNRRWEHPLYDSVSN